MTSRCRCSPAGQSESPSLSPSATQPLALVGFTDPLDLLREGRCPPETVPSLTWQHRSNTGQHKEAPSGREEKGRLGRTAGPRRKQFEATNVSLFLFSSSAVSSDPTLGVF